MTEVATEVATEAASTVAVFTLPNLTGERSFDCATIPGDTRLDLLKNAVRGYISNRVNAAQQRYQKDEDVIAWSAYDEACKADPLQTTVVKPNGERPVPVDLEEAYKRAIDALTTGEIRKQSGEPKARARKDPLIATVTDIVVREVFDSRKAADPKYTFLAAKKEVGTDGVAYLNNLIEAKVAQGVDRGALEKMRDTKYINPAKVMLGLNDTKAIKELPSLF